MASIIVVLQNKLRLSSGTVQPLTPHSPGSMAKGGHPPCSSSVVKTLTEAIPASLLLLKDNMRSNIVSPCACGSC